MGLITGIDSPRDVSPEKLKGLNSRDLVRLHYRIHEQYDLLSKEGKAIEDLVNAHVFIVEEFNRRSRRHPILPGKLDKLEIVPNDKEWAPVYGSGNVLGEEIYLEDVIHHFKSFKIREPVVYLVGGICERKKTKGDIDILVRGDMTPEMRHIIQFRIGRSFPPELSKRIQFVEDEYGGPFTNHMPLADLVVQMRDNFEVKEMSLDEEKVEKAEDIFQIYPPASTRRGVVQLHFRGKSLHMDFRTDVGEHLIGWTLAAQKAGVVPDVQNVSEARDIIEGYDPKTGNKYLKPMWGSSRVYATEKAAQPKEWLDVEGVVEPGGTGATRYEEGLFLVVDKPQVEFGYQAGAYHEYFLTNSKIGWNGILYFRQIDREGLSLPGEPSTERLMWLAAIEEGLLPYILSRRAVRRGRIPPVGVSAIPRSLMAQTPKEYQYWREKSTEKAKEVRDALVESRYFTESNVRLVDGEFRRVEEKRFVSKSVDTALGCVFCGAPGTINVRYVDRFVSVCRDCVPEAEGLIASGSLPPYVERQFDYGAPRNCAAPHCTEKASRIVPFADSSRSFFFSCEKHLALLKSAFGGDEGSDLRVEQEATRFRLLRTAYKGQQVIRVGPSNVRWDLLVHGGPHFRFESGEPLSSSQSTAVIEHGNVWNTVGEQEPGSPLNPSKNTSAFTTREDEGVAVILESKPELYRIEFKGKKLRGVRLFEREDKNSSIYIYKPSSLPETKAIGSGTLQNGGALPPAHLPENLEDEGIRLDLQKIENVEEYDAKKVSDEVLRDDFRIALAWYSTLLRNPRGLKYSKSEVLDLLVKIINELVERGPEVIRFSPSTMREYAREGFDEAVRRGKIEIPEEMLKGAVQEWDITSIESGRDRETIKPLARFTPMKSRPGQGGSFRTVDDILERFATPEKLKDGIVVEPKYNGLRFIMERNEEGETLLYFEDTRRDRTRVLPSISRTMVRYSKSLILDGELRIRGNSRRAELARFTQGDAPVDDSDVVVHVFGLLYHDGVQYVDKPWSEMREELEKVVPKLSSRFEMTPYRIVNTAGELRSAVEWASSVQGSEGAMFKLPGSTYSLGGVTDSWAKYKEQREVVAEILERITKKPSPSQESPSKTYIYRCGIPISEKEWELWTGEKDEVDGKQFAVLGKTFATNISAEVGERLKVAVTELLLRGEPPHSIAWFTPTVVEVTKESLDTSKTLQNLAHSEEIIKHEMPLEVFKSVENGEERVVGGVVLKPAVTDLQGDIYYEDDVRRAAHYFLEQYYPGGSHGMRMMHQGSILTDKIRILESYLLPFEWKTEISYLGKAQKTLTIPKGTWIMIVRILDEQLWDEIKNKKFNGFSIGAWVRGTKL